MTELQRLQHLRRPRFRDNTIDTLLRNAQQSAKEQRRRLGSAIDLWQELVDEPLRSRTRITGLRSGVLAVSVDTSADRFVLDRTLRSGLLRKLQRRARMPLTRVRVTVDPARDAR